MTKTNMEKVRNRLYKKFVDHDGVDLGDISWVSVGFDELWVEVSKELTEAEERGKKRWIKLGREAGIISTFPCVDLDDESNNCFECGHSHALAGKYCRCDCCVRKLK